MQTVMIALPETQYEAARQVAEATGQRIEDVLQASLARTLPPLDDVAPDEQAALAALAVLDDAALWRVARDTFTPEQQSQMHELLDKQSADEITEPEIIQLTELVNAYGQKTVHKAHAYLLLARRGYHVPMQDPAR